VIAILWRYRVPAAAEKAFEAAYGPAGAWAKLFGQAAGFMRTELLREGEGVYATLDYWSDLASFEAFKRAFGEDYARLDAECETLIEAEERLGLFEVVAD
jgi:heme-degrading monooxygenase HmoA